jgi:hypothetical protein
MNIPPPLLHLLSDISSQALATPSKTFYIEGDAPYCKRLALYHAHLKRCMAEESITSGDDKDDPLYGWGKLAYQLGTTHRKVDQDNEHTHVFRLKTLETLHPTQQMYFIRCIAIKDSIPCPVPRNVMSVQRNRLLKPNKLFYPALREDLFLTWVQSDKQGGSIIHYRHADTEITTKEILLQYDL